MQILYFFIGWMIGIFVFPFTIISAFMVLTFCIPATRNLEKMELLKKDNNILRNYYISLFLLPLVFIGVTYLIYNFFPNAEIGFIFGIIMTFFGIRKSVNRQSIISEYVESNKKHFKDEKEEEILRVMWETKLLTKHWHFLVALLGLIFLNSIIAGLLIDIIIGIFYIVLIAKWIGFAIGGKEYQHD